MAKAGSGETRQRVLQFIRDYVDERGYAPTIRDILRGLCLSSTSVVQYHLNVLERNGQIRRDRDVFRSIQLAGQKRSVSVPLLGTIAAGAPLPVLSTETWTGEAEEMLDIPAHLTRGRDVYALRVRGQSMIEALISDGDIVLLEAVSTADDGDTVAVSLKEEQGVTLKRFFREANRIRLQPANEAIPPIYASPENVQVQGRVVGVLRVL